MPILFATILLDLIGFGIVIPILPFMAPQLGADKLDIALLIVVYAAAAGVCGPFWGRLSDRLGRKPVLIICLSGGALSYVGLALATELWMIYLARTFAGLAAGNFGVATAMIADITTPANRAKGMGMLGAAFGLGMVLGPVLGGTLAGSDGSFMLPCIVAGTMSVAAIIAALFFLPESHGPQQRADHRAHHGSQPTLSLLAMLTENGNRLLVLQFSMHTACVTAITYLLPLWVGDLLGWGAREVGIIFGAQGLMMAILQGLLVGPLSQWMGELRFLRTGVCIMLVGLIMAIFATTTVPMIAAFLIAATGGTFTMPILNSIATKRTPAMLRGRMMGTTSSAGSWGRVVGPLVAGAGLYFYGYPQAWVLCVVMALCLVFWAFFLVPDLSLTKK
ncbi:MFS transporter [Halieaceae bacterium IMCC14734]|uniref:MFS transporter n=1 Tax=Candidatus Litorirhabdus singularis TaxID=2518993 RepID=A0ABT3TDA0_9GAMM|nr:MFS transporter [Candidatus Litorirhabdus singularis]